MSSDQNTKKSNSKDALELIRALNESIVVLGARKVIRYLGLIKNVYNNPKKQLSDLIIHTVCDKYQIDFDVLKESTRNDGDNYDALCCIAALLAKHALLNGPEIGEKINRHKPSVSKYLSRMEKLNPAVFKQDRGIHQIFIELDQNIEEIIENEQLQWEQKIKEDAEDPAK